MEKKQSTIVCNASIGGFRLGSPQNSVFFRIFSDIKQMEQSELTRVYSREDIEFFFENKLPLKLKEKIGKEIQIEVLGIREGSIEIFFTVENIYHVWEFITVIYTTGDIFKHISQILKDYFQTSDVNISTIQLPRGTRHNTQETIYPVFSRNEYLLFIIIIAQMLLLSYILSKILQ